MTIGRAARIPAADHANRVAFRGLPRMSMAGRGCSGGWPRGFPWGCLVSPSPAPGEPCTGDKGAHVYGRNGPGVNSRVTLGLPIVLGLRHRIWRSAAPWMMRLETRRFHRYVRTPTRKCRSAPRRRACVTIYSCLVRQPTCRARNLPGIFRGFQFGFRAACIGRAELGFRLLMH